jgi:hypothetical protein
VRILVSIVLAALVAGFAGYAIAHHFESAERQFCRAADSQTYCLDHPEKGDDERLGA